MQKDSRNNVFVDFEDTRFTLVVGRDPGTDWSGSAVLRIQKYNDPANSQSLRPGPEIPLGTKDDFVRLVTQLLNLVQLMP